MSENEQQTPLPSYEVRVKEWWDDLLDGTSENRTATLEAVDEYVAILKPFQDQYDLHKKDKNSDLILCSLHEIELIEDGRYEFVAQRISELMGHGSGLIEGESNAKTQQTARARSCSQEQAETQRTLRDPIIYEEVRKIRESHIHETTGEYNISGIANSIGAKIDSEEKRVKFFRSIITKCDSSVSDKELSSMELPNRIQLLNRISEEKSINFDLSIGTIRNLLSTNKEKWEN